MLFVGNNTENSLKNVKTKVFFSDILFFSKKSAKFSTLKHLIVNVLSNSTNIQK